jgi:intracellular septation protein A
VKRSETFHRLRLLLIDVVAPIAAYHALHAAGVADLPALLAGSGVAAADALVSLAIERRVHSLQILACAMFALTGSLAFATHGPRVVSLKPSIASLAFGVYLLGLSASRRALSATWQVLIAHGSKERAARWRLA